MMSGYPSIRQAMGGAAPAAASACRCSQQCFCPPGQPCRCSGGCSCRHTQAASRAAAWTESQEGELARRRSSAQRSRAYGLMQRRSAMQADWNRRSRMNGMFARRFSWGAQLPRVAGAIGSGNARPDSSRFMFALARWQKRNGMPANGMLTPNVWRALLNALRRRPVPPAPQSAWPARWPAPWPAPWPATPPWPQAAPAAPAFPGTAAGAPGGQYSPYAPGEPFAASPPFPAPDGDSVSAGGEPGLPADDAAMPLPGDQGAADAPPSEEMWPGYGLGFRSRHPVPY